jgi:hypothetical protein
MIVYKYKFDKIKHMAFGINNNDILKFIYKINLSENFNFIENN